MARNDKLGNSTIAALETIMNTMNIHISHSYPNIASDINIQYRSLLARSELEGSE